MSSVKKIQAFIIKHLQYHPEDIVAFTMLSMGVTRTTVRRHLNHLIRDGKVYKTGVTRDSHYTLQGTFDKKVIIKLPSKSGEFEIYKENFEPNLTLLPKNIVNICVYGVTEMINNAFEHANAKRVIVEMLREKSNIIFLIRDDGIGMFRKIADFLHFSGSERINFAD